MSFAAAGAALPDSLEHIEAELLATQATLVEKLQDELVCVVCGCVFIDPRVLHCQHCFCLRCLYSTVARDRGPQLEVPCAYRCEEMTVTRGDIRTLPKNHYITNTCILLRQHLVRRARLLEKKLVLLGDASDAAAHPSVGETPEAAADSHTPPTADLPHGSSAAQLLLKKEKDAVKELYECEWCSCSSPSCEVCPYCFSRVCAECRGQFSDHQYLCMELHQPGRRPPEGWLPGAAPSGLTAMSASAGLDGNASTTTRAQASLTALDGEYGAAAHTTAQHDASFPFYFTPFFIPTLVKECLVKQHNAPLQLSEVDVANVVPVRLSVPEVAVECQHLTTGFSFDYIVHPTVKTAEGVEVDVNLPHWSDGDGKPHSTLSFLSNATRLGETVLQDLHKLSTATSEVVLELSSAAHQAYVRRNKGFHMYALHVWSLVRAQCQVAREALLPHLERARLLENIMGDLVTYRFQQTMNRASAPQKHVIRDRCMAFLKTEIHLCRQLDQVMEGIDAACRGISALLGRMREVMKELAQPKVHRGEEHKKSRQSRLRFSAQIFRSRQEEQQRSHSRTPLSDKAHEEGMPQTRAKVMRSGAAAARRSASQTATPTGAAADTVLNVSAEPDSTFRGQVAEHQTTTQALSDSLLSILRCFMQARVWEWSLGNTCIRECGLGEEDRRTLLSAEEELQLLTDDLLKVIWSNARLVYVLEVQQDEAGPASSLDILMDTETLALLDAGMDCPTYEHNEVFEGLKALSQLRNQLLSGFTANIMTYRNPDTQQELLKMMSSVLNTTMTHQVSVLRCVTSAESLQADRFTAYLRTRQMPTSVGEAPPLGEGTLLAVDVLKALQRYSGVQLANASATAAAAGSAAGPGAVRPSQSYPVATNQKGAKELPVSSAPPLSNTASNAWPLPHALVTDFSRRDTALISCQRYGEALVRAANGQPLREGRSSLADTNAATAAATLNESGSEAGLPSFSLFPPSAMDLSLWQDSLAPPLFHVEEEPPFEMTDAPTVSRRGSGDNDAPATAAASGTDRSGSAPHTQVTTLRARGSNDGSDGEATANRGEVSLLSPPFAGDPAVATNPLPLHSSPEQPREATSSMFATSPHYPPSSLRTVDVDGAPDATADTAPGSPVSAPSPATDASAPPVHEELLFEADCGGVAVGLVAATAADSDEHGRKKAMKLFKATFQLPATSAHVGERHVAYLPFYRGECTYKGVSTTFYVDAQTGTVSVNPQQLCMAGRRQYFLELLSSPLFFILLNSTLSIVLHKRYNLEISHK